MRDIDVIIPISHRPEFVSCVDSLMTAEDYIDRIVLVFGGPEAREEAKEFSDLAGRMLSISFCDQEVFNKAELINIGLMRSSARFQLLSDADIIWNEQTILLLKNSCSHKKVFSYVEKVTESRRSLAPSNQGRLTFRVDRGSSETTVKIVRDEFLAHSRPGCGLVMASRHAWRDVGGMKTKFTHWGWEDQDLLLRSEILGYQLQSVGEVVHLSHSDDFRNIQSDSTRIESRDRNIKLSLSDLEAGILKGELASNYRAPGERIRVLPGDLSVSCTT